MQNLLRDRLAKNKVSIYGKLCAIEKGTDWIQLLTRCYWFRFMMETVLSDFNMWINSLEVYVTFKKRAGVLYGI